MVRPGYGETLLTTDRSPSTDQGIIAAHRASSRLEHIQADEGPTGRHLAFSAAPDRPEGVRFTPRAVSPPVLGRRLGDRLGERLRVL